MGKTPKTKPAGRTRSGQFAPGVSGNPGGRRAEGNDVRAMAREHTSECIAVLVSIMQDKKAAKRDRAYCSVALLDRGWGKPAHTVIVEKQADTMSTDELLAEIEQLTALVRTKGNA